MKYKNLSFLMLYIFNFLKNLMFFGAVSVPFFLHRAGLDYTGMFVLESIFSISMILFEIPTGVIADRIGRKVSLFLGALVFGSSFLILGLFTSFYVLIIAEIICGLGMTMISGADTALIYELLQEQDETEKATTIFSRYHGFATLGMLLAFPLGSFFVSSNIVSYNEALGIVFLATGMAILLSGVIILMVREPKLHKSSESGIRKGIQGFQYIFKVPSLRMFSLNFAAISSLTFFMFWFYQALLMENDFPIRWQGGIASTFNLSATLLLFLAPYIQKRFSSKNLLFVTSLGPGLLYLLLAFIGGLPFALFAIFGVTNMRIYRQPMLVSLMNNNIQSNNRATVLSGVSMIERILTALLYPVAGLLADISLNIAFGILGVITIFLSIILRVETGSQNLQGINTVE